MMYDLSLDHDREQFKARANALYTAKVCVELTEKKAQRTTAQNSYLHTLIAYFAAETGFTAEQVKVDFYKRAANAELYVEKINRFGTDLEKIRSSRDLTTDEMALSIDRFKTWAAQVAMVYLPDAENTQHMTFAQRMIAANKEFI